MKKDNHNTNLNIPTHSDLYQALAKLPPELIPSSSLIRQPYSPIQPRQSVSHSKVSTKLQTHDTISNYPTFPELYQALAHLPPLIVSNSSSICQPVSDSTAYTNVQTQDFEKKRKINQSNNPKLPTKKVKVNEIRSTYTQSTVGSSSADSHSEVQTEIKLNDSITRTLHKKGLSQDVYIQKENTLTQLGYNQAQMKGEYHYQELKTLFDSTEITQPTTPHNSGAENTPVPHQSAHSTDEFLEPWEILSPPLENNTVPPQNQSPNILDFLNEIDYIECQQTNQPPEDIFDYFISQIGTSTNEQDVRQNRHNESPTLFSTNPNSLFFHEDLTPEDTNPLEKNNLCFKY